MARPRCLSFAALGALALLSVAACRSKPSGGEAAPVEAGAPAKATAADDGDAGASGGSEESFVEAGNRFRDAEPKVVASADGPIDATCSGTGIALAVVVIDKRCAIGSGRAKQLRALLERDGGVAVPLKQTARTGADGRVILEVQNAGSAPLTLPLSFSAKLPAFTVIAEDERHSLYELEPPRLEVVASAAERDRPHFARIVLAPGGVATTSLTIDAAVARVVRRGPGDKCDGGPACTPARLPKGRYTMHVGELLTDVEAGAPARVVVELP